MTEPTHAQSNADAQNLNPPEAPPVNVTVVVQHPPSPWPKTILKLFLGVAVALLIFMTIGVLNQQRLNKEMDERVEKMKVKVMEK